MTVQYYVRGPDREVIVVGTVSNGMTLEALEKELF